MQKMKIEKRIMAEVESLRKLAAYLPAGKANALNNKCGKILGYARKAQALVDSPRPPYRNEPFDARDEVDISATAKKRGALLAALLAGRTLSLENAQEIGTTAFATLMSQVRAEIERRNLPYHLNDMWVYPGDGRCKYKKYWLSDKEPSESSTN